MATPNGMVCAAPVMKKKVRCRNLDPLRFALKYIKEGKLQDHIKTLQTNPELVGIFRDRLLASRVPKGQSPLVEAAQFNRKDILVHILDNYPVNLEQETSTDIEGGHPVEGATPLWTASTLGHLDIVKELITRGADIEHTTDSHSSPLRGAAFDGHLPVVEYLIDQGADIDKPNQVGQSPLTIAAAMRKMKTVEFLLKKGANIHHRGHNGDTPLHVAVESGSSEITKVLVEAGAKNIPNDVGYTPAIMACCYGHQGIMKYLNDTFTLAIQERYDCYCLLVAKEVLNSSFVGALEWLLKAVEMRQQHPELSSSLSKPAPIYDGIQEPDNDDDAHQILNDNVLSFFLCSIYCERILGAIHPTTPFYIRISGDMALEECKYEKCMQLWLRSLEFDQAARMAYELQIIEDLLFSVRGFYTMIEAGYIPEIHQHFEWGIKEFMLAKESKICEVDVVYCLCRLLAIWFRAIDIIKEKKHLVQEKERLQTAVTQLCDLVKERETPLLIACLRNVTSGQKQAQVSAATSIAKSKLPLHKVLAAFLDHGCPVNCEDSMGNFPLHLAVQLNEDSSLNCVQTLIDYGAHLDAVNHANETALDLALKKPGFNKHKTLVVELLKKSHRQHLSLQCLSAITVVHEGLPYVGVLPSFLISFVAEHETDGLEEPVNITEVFDDIEASSVDDDHSIASSNMT